MAGRTSRVMLLFVVAPPALVATTVILEKIPTSVGLALRMTKFVPTTALEKPGGRLVADQVTGYALVFN